MGVTLYELRHDFAAAEAEFREAIRLNPDDADAESVLRRRALAAGSIPRVPG